MYIGSCRDECEFGVGVRVLASGVKGTQLNRSCRVRCVECQHAARPSPGWKIIVCFVASDSFDSCPRVRDSVGRRKVQVMESSDCSKWQSGKLEVQLMGWWN